MVQEIVSHSMAVYHAFHNELSCLVFRFELFTRQLLMIGDPEVGMDSLYENLAGRTRAIARLPLAYAEAGIALTRPTILASTLVTSRMRL